MNSNVRADSRTLLVLSTAMLLAASVSITSTAYADEQLGGVETVNFQDLDVNTPAGAQALYGRIHAAAIRVCDSNISSDPFGPLLAADCAREAVAKAVEHLNLPALTAYYNMSTGGKTPTLSVKR
jgi:UrcA family protein